MNDKEKPIHVYRGEYIESAHDIHIAVVTAKGQLLAYYGDANRLTFARSSMKPFQSIPAVESGAIEAYEISNRELALFCASHIGEPYHRITVANVLQKIGLEEEHLQCGTHVPKHHESYLELIRAGKELTPSYSNCSGKHAGMLTACVKQGLDIRSYRELSHPYQQQILAAISDVTEFEQNKIATSVDGCGVPVHRVPLAHLALAFGRLASPDQWEAGTDERKTSLRQIRDAMTAYPEMVAGTNQFDTDLMTVFQNRIVSKGGAEGVQCFGDRETGIGVALKVGDGNARGVSVASVEVLRQLNIGDEAIWDRLATYWEAPVHNALDEKIGVIKPNFTLNTIGKMGE